MSVSVTDSYIDAMLLHGDVEKLYKKILESVDNPFCNPALIYIAIKKLHNHYEQVPSWNRYLDVISTLSDGMHPEFGMSSMLNKFKENHDFVECYECAGYGHVSDYGLMGLDFFGEKECKICCGSGRLVRYKNGGLAVFPGGPIVGNEGVN